MFNRLLHMRVVLVGGNANNSVKAGSFYVNSNNSFTNSNSSISGRLYLFLTFVSMTMYAITLPLGKTQSKASYSLVSCICSREKLEAK